MDKKTALPERKKPLVLVVDNNPANLDVVVSYLEKQDLECAVAKSGQSGLDRAILTQPDIILLDILMPEMDGYEVCQRLKKSKKTADIPVIFMTALSTQEDKVEGFRAGGVDYITKPIQQEELLARITTHLDIRKLNLDLKRKNLDLLKANRKLEKEIVSRKRSDEALKKAYNELELRVEELRKLTRAVEQSPASIIITDTEGSIEYVNPRFTEVTGFSKAEVIGKNPRLLKSGEQSEGFYKDLWNTITSGKVWRGEFHNRKKSGELFWEHASISPIINEEGEITNFVAVKEDITERKKILESLRLYSNIVSATHDHMSFVDSNYVYQAANDTFLKVHGKKREEVIGHSVVELQGQEKFDQVVKGMLDWCSTGEAVHHESWFHFAEKGDRYMEVNYYPFYEKDNVFSGAVVSSRDITARKEAEEEIKRSEQKFRELSQQFQVLLNAIPDRLALISHDIKVQWSNRGNAYKSKPDETEAKPDHCKALWPGLSEYCPECPAEKSFMTGQIETVNVDSGDGRTWEIKAFPIINETGKVINVIEWASEITEKIRIQEETMQAGKMASIGELAAGVAHEINNPINSIVNLSQILANETPKESDAYDILSRIISEGKRISVIVRGLLSFARKGEGVMEPVEIGNILADCLLLSEIQMKKDNIVLKTDIPAGLPRVTANYQQLQQVFLNVINNAHYALNEKYPGIDDDKILKISVEKVAISGQPSLRTTFYDQGTGISPEIRDKLIEPFFSTKPQHHGTGLGLSSSYGIVNTHGGKITFDSVEGEFTKVIVDLPLRL